MIFSDVVEAIKGFSTEEKLEIQLLLQQYLREERREEENGELPFSVNIDELKQQNISRHELMKLPREERQKILAAQSEVMLEHYQQNQEWQELQ